MIRRIHAHRRDPNPATRAEKAKVLSRLAAYTAVGLVILAMAISILVLVIRQNSGQQRAATTLQNTQDAKRTLHILIDCTTPRHKCFVRGQRATANAVSQLSRISVLASSCAAKLPDPSPSKVEHCVLAHLK